VEGEAAPDALEAKQKPRANHRLIALAGSARIDSPTIVIAAAISSAAANRSRDLRTNHAAVPIAINRPISPATPHSARACRYSSRALRPGPRPT